MVRAAGVEGGTRGRQHIRVVFDQHGCRVCMALQPGLVAPQECASACVPPNQTRPFPPASGAVWVR